MRATTPPDRSPSSPRLPGAAQLFPPGIAHGIYTDPVYHVGVAMTGTNVATPSIICHGNHYYFVRAAPVKSGRFSYAGVAAKANGPGLPAQTKEKLTITGHFVTTHRLTGTAAVAGSEVSYTAKYTGSHS